MVLSYIVHNIYLENLFKYDSKVPTLKSFCSLVCNFKNTDLPQRVPNWKYSKLKMHLIRLTYQTLSSA